MPSKMPAGYVVKGFNKGQPIFREGQDGSYACIINTGKVQVSKEIDGKTVVLAELERGQVFGEMALVASEKRTATVTAMDYTEVVVVDRGHLKKIMDTSNPMMQTLVQGLVMRLETTTAMLRQEQTDDEKFMAIVRLLQGLTERLGADPDGVVRYPLVRLIELTQETGVANRRAVDEAIKKLFSGALISLERANQGRDLAVKNPDRLVRKAEELVKKTRKVELGG